MASIRQTWTVAWDGGEPIRVQTTAQDIINAVDMVPATSSTNRVAINTSLIYSALVRHRLCSLKYEKWLEVLDMFEEEPGVQNGEGPTKEAASAQEPSPLPASREPIGRAGSIAKTPDP